MQDLTLNAAKCRYKLIGLDQMEPSIVRRVLHQWSGADEQAIRPLVLAMQQKHGLSNVHIRAPRWETNVYPLYYWAHRLVGGKRVVDHVLELLPELFPTSKVSLPAEELREHITHTVNSEIDILVEDLEYFLFVEAKIAAGNQKIKFERKGDVHQMVSQYVQGSILGRLIRKTFALGTIGVSKGQTIKILLNRPERELLRLVNDERQALEIPNIPWKLLTTTFQAAEHIIRDI